MIKHVHILLSLKLLLII